MNTEDLIKTKPGEELPAAICAVNDVKMTAAELFQTQRHASHGAHESGIHHRAIFQVNHKFAVPAIDHFARELLQVPAVQEASFTLDLHPDGWAVHPNLNR